MYAQYTHCHNLDTPRQQFENMDVAASRRPRENRSINRSLIHCVPRPVTKSGYLWASAADGFCKGAARPQTVSVGCSRRYSSRVPVSPLTSARTASSSA